MDQRTSPSTSGVPAWLMATWIFSATQFFRWLIPTWLQIAISVAVLAALAWQYRSRRLRWPPDLSGSSLPTLHRSIAPERSESDA